MDSIDNWVSYSTNNSGGGWWLDDDDWHALEEAGWVVDWVATSPHYKKYADSDGRWLGALATHAYRYGLPEELAIAEWEYVTGENAESEGCPCCGQPHYFSDDEPPGVG